MPTLLIPNFAFEDSLSGRTRHKPVDHPAQQDLASAMGWLADSGDGMLRSDANRPQELPEELSSLAFATESQLAEFDRVLPWGWDHNSRRLAESMQPSQPSIPEDDCVRKVNGRAFNCEFDTVIANNDSMAAFDHQFSRYCRTIAEWEAAVQHLHDYGFEKWVTKTELSHAGRNRLLGHGLELNEQQSGWLKRQLRQDGVAVEPWVTRLREFSLQFEIEAGGDLQFIGQTELINDPMGRYQGSLIATSFGNAPPAWLTKATQICRQIHETGYFGPVGIDGFRFQHQCKTAFRICNDINARLTMGRLALEVATKLGHSSGFWRQIVPTKGRAANFRDELAIVKSALTTGRWKNVSCHRTSAFQVGQRPVRLGTAFFSGVDFRYEGPFSISEFDSFLRSVR